MTQGAMPSGKNSSGENTSADFRTTVEELLDFAPLSEHPSLQQVQEKYANKARQIVKAQHIDIPEDILRVHALEIVSTFSGRSCQGCGKEPDKVTRCFQPHLRYDATHNELSVEFSPCPYAADARKKRKYEDELKDILVSPRFRSRTFDNFYPSEQSKKLLEFLREWVSSYRTNCRGFYIYGGVGAGKTHLAVAALLAVHEIYHEQCMYMVVPSFLDELRANMATGEALQKRFRLYSEVPVLLIDDLGEGRKENGTLSSWAREKLYMLINDRYEHERTTIVTSVYSPREIGDIIGDSTISRLIEMCYFLHTLDGDHRYSNFKIIE